jgi:hypothetical protein
LGFNVSRDAKINASNGLEFKNADDAKSFLKLVKSKAPQETVFAHLEKYTTNFAKNYQNYKIKIPKSKGIVVDENFSISNSGCGNWNNAIAFHTGFSMFSTIHFGANIDFKRQCYKFKFLAFRFYFWLFLESGIFYFQ